MKTFFEKVAVGFLATVGAAFVLAGTLTMVFLLIAAVAAIPSFALWLPLTYLELGKYITYFSPEGFMPEFWQIWATYLVIQIASTAVFRGKSSKSK